MIIGIKYGTIKLLEKEWVLPALLFDTDILERLIMKKKMRAVDLVNQEFNKYNEEHGLILSFVELSIPRVYSGCNLFEASGRPFPARS